MASRVKIVSDILLLLEQLTGDDVDYVLRAVNGAYPRVGAADANVAPVGPKGSTVAAPAKAKPKGKAKVGGTKTVAGANAPAVVTPRANASSGGYGSKAPLRGADPTPQPPTVGGGQGGQTGPKTTVPGNDRDQGVLKDVLLKIGILAPFLPTVSREAGADPPSMDRGSVQKRLNRKRVELQKGFEAILNQSDDDRSSVLNLLNQIQRFRLAALDAISTEGIHLRTDPIPEDYRTWSDVLKNACQERIDSGMVSDYGFFLNDDHLYDPPVADLDSSPNGDPTPSLPIAEDSRNENG